MRSDVLKEHNSLRSQLANGKIKAAGEKFMPRSSNMQKLVGFTERKLLKMRKRRLNY